MLAGLKLLNYINFMMSSHADFGLEVLKVLKFVKVGFMSKLQLKTPSA